MVVPPAAPGVSSSSGSGPDSPELPLARDAPAADPCLFADALIRANHSNRFRLARLCHRRSRVRAPPRGVVRPVVRP